jgi:protein ImuB
MARLQGMLGPDAVVTAVVGGGRGPAEQVRLVPWGDVREPALPAGPVRVSTGAETPPWPGRVPPPAPATVHVDPVPAEVVDGDGQPVGISARGRIGAVPVRVSVAGGRWADVAAWAGPWPADERWWDPQARRRRARLQVELVDGSAHLVTLERGRWWIEASYD